MRGIHENNHRDTEITEVRIDSSLCVLCASVVNILVLDCG